MTTTDHALRLSCGGALALAVALGVGRFAYTPILPAMMLELGLTKTQAGMLASANVLGYLAGALSASRPILYGSQRSWFVGSLAVSAATTLSMGAATDLTMLAALRFLGGVASALALVHAATLVLDRLAALDRSKLSSICFAGVGLGIVLSTLVVGMVLAHGSGWRGAWIAVGALASLAALAAARLVPPPTRERSSDPTAPRIPMPIGLPLGATMTAYFLFGLGYAPTMTFLVAISRSVPALQAIGSVVWLVVGLAACPSLALWNLLGRRIGTVRAFGLALLVEALGVAGSVFAGDAASGLVAAALLGGTFVPITAFGLLVARGLARGNERRVAALMTAAFSVGSIVAPPVFGWLSDLTGSFTPSSLAAAGALALAALVSQGAHRSGRRSAYPAALPA